MEERELVAEYKGARDEVDRLEDELKKAKDRFEKAQLALVDDLQARQASQTAKYDGLGRISLLKPIVGARSTDEEKLFSYLKEVGRDDLMRMTVHHKTLSTFVKEMLEEGRQIPEFIEFWFKPSTRLNS